MFNIRLSDESKKTIEKMASLTKKMQDAIRLSLDQGALLIQNKAKELSPYKTGNLRRSITHGIVSGSDGFAQAIGSGVIYARIHEYGGNTGRNGKTRLQPYRGTGYFRPAIVYSHAGIQNYFDTNIQNAVNS